MDVKIGQVYKRPQDTVWKMVFMVSGTYVATMSLMKTNKFWENIDMSLGEFGWPNPTKVENAHMDTIGDLMGTVSIRDYRKVMNVIHDFTMGRIRFVPRVGYMYIDEIEDIALECKEMRGEVQPTKREPDKSNVHRSNFPAPKKVAPPAPQVETEPEETVKESVVDTEVKEEPEKVKEVVIESEDERLEKEKHAIAMTPAINLLKYYDKFIKKCSDNNGQSTTKRKVGRKQKSGSIEGRDFNHDEIINIASMPVSVTKQNYDISFSVANNIRAAALDILGMRDKVGKRINWKAIFDNCNSYNMEEEIKILAEEYQTTVSFVKTRYTNYLDNREGLLTFNQFYPELKKTIKNGSMKDIASIESSTIWDISKIYGISIAAAKSVKLSLKDDYLNKDPLFVVFGSIVFDNDAFANYIESVRSSSGSKSKAIIEVYERILKVRKQYTATYFDHAAIVAERKKAPNFYTEQERNDFIMLLKHRFNMSTSINYLTDDEKMEILDTRSSSDLARKYLVTPDTIYSLKETIKTSLKNPHPLRRKLSDADNAVLESAT